MSYATVFMIQLMPIRLLGRGLDQGFIRRANLYATDYLVPDLTLLFDLSAEKAAERKQKLSRATDRLENEKLAFFRNVRKGYLDLAKKEPRRFRIINASQSIEDVRQETATVLAEFSRKKNLRIGSL